MGDLNPTVDSGSNIAIVRLIGVYNAEGTLRGELTYWVGARLGSVHCALCDITHGTFREKPAWRSCRSDLAVPFDAFHLNDQPEIVRGLTEEVGAPIVAAQTTSEAVLLLDGEALDACRGSGERMVEALERRVADLGLVWV